MCGIYGILCKNLSKENVISIKKFSNELASLSQVRGKDSSGIVVKNSVNEEICYFKESVPATKMMKMKKHQDLIDRSLKSKEGEYVALIGHCRMSTNGGKKQQHNNQPIHKNEYVCAHNGIITNDKEMWTQIDRIPSYEVDTEVIIEAFDYYYNQSKCIAESLSSVYKSIVGEASIAMLSSKYEEIVLTSNVGSLYVIATKDMIIFASEKFILDTLVKKFAKELDEREVVQITPNSLWIINPRSLMIKRCLLNYTSDKVNKTYHKSEFKYLSFCSNEENINLNSSRSFKQRSFKKLLQYNTNQIKELKRCSKCVLPETFPFIEFDEQGECNYCKMYKKYETKGKSELDKILKDEKKCLLTFSGGRDSCYGLHYILNNLNMKITAYTYDWGMVTDLARRNQARMCGKTGVEHIIVAADIDKKRSNVHKNVKAWLKRPQLGTVPLFMAGDKQYFYYANKIAKQNNQSIIVLCDNPLEVTYFKYGFCGVKPNFHNKGQLFKQSFSNRFRMLMYYAKEFTLNPLYWNKSLIDSMGGFISYYFISHNYVNLFNYIEWDEKVVEDTLLNQYDWEISPDSTSTWRIGDGTAPFYNYIYCTVAGFTENDTFRSNQVRQGKLSRDEALDLIYKENAPRYESIQWYLDTIGLEFEETIQVINNMKKLY